MPVTENLKKMTSIKKLESLFKNNSKYYKKINNNDIIATRWDCGSGGEFITGLFIDRNYHADMSNRPIRQQLKNNQYYSNNTSFEGRLYKYNTTANYSTIQDILHLNISKEMIKKHDDLLYKTFNSEEDKFFSLHHNGFIISKFYLKNSEKIKIINIDINDDLNYYIDILCMAKTGTQVYDAYLNINQSEIFVPRRHRLMDRKQHQYIFNVIDEIHQTINISKSTVMFGILSQIINWLILHENPPLFYNNKIQFFEAIKTNLTNLLNKDDVSTHGSDLIDLKTIWKDQLYTVSYKDLFFNQDITIIKDLMNFYESTKEPNYYKTQIKKYHIENLKLVNEVKKELPTTIKNIERELQND